MTQQAVADRVGSRSRPRRVIRPRAAPPAPPPVVVSPPTVVPNDGSATAREIVPTLVATDMIAGATGAGAALVAFTALQPVRPSVVAIILAVTAVLLWSAALILVRAYETRYLYAGSSELNRVGTAAAMTGIPVLMASWLTVDPRHAGFVILGASVCIAQALVCRWYVRSRAQRANRAGTVRSRVLAVGDEVDLDTFRARLERNCYHGWAVVGSITFRSPAEAALEVSFDRVVEAARRAEADLVLLTPSASAHIRSVTELLRALQTVGVELALAPPMVEAVGPRVSIEPVCGLPLVRITGPELKGPRRWLKATADRGAALVGLLLVAPLLLVLAAAVRLTSPGPAFFRQERVGRGGVPFTMVKFRSMYLDAEERLTDVLDQNRHAGGPLFKVARDPRVTVVGRLLRKTSLDELPQLLNVVTGQMSLVGPRPALPREVEAYDEDTRRRLLVAPGLTGLWQIHGRSDLDWDESRRLDLRYVENWSLGFDLSILVRTFDAVVRGRGAY